MSEEVLSVPQFLRWFKMLTGRGDPSLALDLIVYIEVPPHTFVVVWDNVHGVFSCKAEPEVLMQRIRGRGRGGEETLARSMMIDDDNGDDDGDGDEVKRRPWPGRAKKLKWSNSCCKQLFMNWWYFKEKLLYAKQWNCQGVLGAGPREAPGSILFKTSWIIFESFISRIIFKLQRPGCSRELSPYPPPLCGSMVRSFWKWSRHFVFAAKLTAGCRNVSTVDRSILYWSHLTNDEACGIF